MKTKESLYEYKKAAFDYLSEISNSGVEFQRKDIVNFLRAKFKNSSSDKIVCIIGTTNIIFKALIDYGYALRISRGKYCFVSKMNVSFDKFLLQL